MLKHKAEDFSGHYVANGTFIAAALALGFRAQPTGSYVTVHLIINLD